MFGRLGCFILFCFILFMTEPVAASECDADCNCSGLSIGACVASCQGSGAASCRDGVCGGTKYSCCCISTGGVFCDIDSCGEIPCGGPFFAEDETADRWSLVSYEVASAPDPRNPAREQLRIFNAEVLYASSSSFAATKIREIEETPPDVPGNYKVFSWHVPHAVRRSGRPDVKTFGKTLGKRLDGLLPAEGYFAVRLKMRSTELLDYEVLVSEPAELSDLIIPSLNLYARLADLPPGKQVVEAMTVAVVDHQVVSTGITKGFFVEP